MIPRDSGADSWVRRKSNLPVLTSSWPNNLPLMSDGEKCCEKGYLNTQSPRPLVGSNELPFLSLLLPLPPPPYPLRWSFHCPSSWSSSFRYGSCSWSLARSALLHFTVTLLLCFPGSVYVSAWVEMSTISSSFFTRKGYAQAYWMLTWKPFRQMMQSVPIMTLINLVPRVLRLLGQRVGARSLRSPGTRLDPHLKIWCFTNWATELPGSWLIVTYSFISSFHFRHILQRFQHLACFFGTKSLVSMFFLFQPLKLNWQKLYHYIKQRASQGVTLFSLNDE